MNLRRIPYGEFGIDQDTVEKHLGRQTYWRSKALWAGKRDNALESYKENIDKLKETILS